MIAKSYMPAVLPNFYKTYHWLILLKKAEENVIDLQYLSNLCWFY